MAADIAASAASPRVDSFRDTETGAALDTLSSFLSDPTVFVTAASEVESAAKAATKAVFDYIAKESAGCGGGDGAGAMPSFALPELHVDGFDTEQIWLQVDLSLDAVLKRCKKLVKRASGAQSLLSEEVAGELVLEEDEDVEDEDSEEDGDIVDLDEEDGTDEEGGNREMDALEEEFGIDQDEEDEQDDDEDGLADEDMDEGSDEGSDEEEAVVLKAGQQGKQGKQGKRGVGDEELAPGEDRFLRFSDMDKFLEDAENQAANEDDEDEDDDEEEGEDGDGSYGDGDPEDDDLEAALERAVTKHKAKRRAAGDDSDDEDEDGEDGEDLTGGAKYSDFFGDEDDGNMAEGDEGSEGEDEEQLTSRAKPKVQMRRAGFVDDEDEDEADESHLSSFERQQRKVMRKIKDMEDAAMAEKSWEMRGEVSANKRPLNSALEADLDFETGVRGVQEVSEEAAENIEEMIKKRCVEGRFDDVIRVVVAPTEKKKAVLELDDQKSSAGLGELYEKDFVRAAAGGLTEDKDDPIRQEAKQLFGELCGKLDALSHFHYAPKPVVEELVIKAEVPALAMEEALPTAVSTASLKAPEETFKASTKGDLKANEELTPAEKKTERAKRKRIAKRKRAEREEMKKNTAASAGGTAQIAGRKSDAENRQASRKVSKAQKGQRSEFVKSGAVFGKLQDQQNALKAGIALGPKKEKPEKSTANLKL